MEVPEKERSQVPPIATTPPHPALKEELLSQSSSGTQISNASGFSLGEAIKRTSLINQEMESWYHPCTEIDTSNLCVATGRRLDQASAVCDLTEFPSIEEGSITPTEVSRRQHAPNVTHSPLLEIQDSRLSPSLPLLATYSVQDRTFFNETLFQQTGMDFAPLRGTPDVSDTASEETSRPLQMSEAVRLAATEVFPDSCSDSFSLSQHPLAGFQSTEINTSLGSRLPWHLPSLSGHIEVEHKHAGEEQTPHLDVGANKMASKEECFGSLDSQKSLDQQLAPSLPPKETRGIASGHDLYLLDSNVPAPLLLEMLEKEVGLSGHGGFLSSSESSSCKSVLGKDPEENEASRPTENVVLVQREPEMFVVPPRQEGRAVPELDSLKLLSDSKGTLLRNISASEQFTANVSQGLVASKGHSMGLGDSCVITGMSPRSLLYKQQKQRVSEDVFEEQESKLVAAMTDCRLNAPAPAPIQPITVSAECGDPCREQVNSMVGIQTRASKSELTLSGFSIEREHKDTGTSPSFNEGSFFGQLAHPIHHSTPGIFTTRTLKQEGPGVPLPVKSILQSPLTCLHEETSTSVHASTGIPSVEEPRVPSVDDVCVPSAIEPLTLQSGQETEHENSDHPRAAQPLKGKIHSLPSLNFMEKVGAWNMSQSMERMSDALALGGSSRISPRQKAYSAIADSLSRILLKQQSQVDLKEGLAASFCGPLSTASLHSYNKKSPYALPLTRSQSENSVMVISRDLSRAAPGSATNRDVAPQPAEDQECVLGVPGMKRGDADVQDPVIQCYTAVLVSTVSSDEETVESVGRGKNLNPDPLITSERVAELLKEEGSSLNGDRESFDGSQNNANELPGIHLLVNRAGMDCFSDVSPDSLNRVSSGAGSCADLMLPSRQTSRRSSAVSGKLHSSLEDGLKTPDDREINIEERIPIYLRNLGIDQSPSSILTPFMLRGPVREIEFSPTELRTLKTSTDDLMQHLQPLEGDSRSVIDITQSTFNSSTLSGPAPVESDTIPDAPVSTELSPQPSRDLLSEGSLACYQWAPHAPTPYPPDSTSEMPTTPKTAEHSQVAPGVPLNSCPGSERSPKCVQALMDRFDSKELGVNREKLPSSRLSQENSKLGTSEESSSTTTVIADGDKEESFLGSQTLKEIDKLLAEAETRTPSKNFILASSISSSTDPGSSLTQRKKMEDSEDSGSAQGSSPGLQRMWSWDETFTRQTIAKENVLPKTFSRTGSLKWEALLAVDARSSGQVIPEISRPTSQVSVAEGGVAKHVRRSEPEGGNNVAVNTNLSVLGSDAEDSKCYAPREIKEVQPASSTEPADSISNILGDFRQVLEKAKEAGCKGSGSSRGSDNSSSVDSLGTKVKTLLQQKHPVMRPTPWGEAEQQQQQQGRGKRHVSLEAGIACSQGSAGVRESDDSSSLDSLAARVKTLLEDERPVMHATQILQSAEEEERKARAWVKLKLAIHPPDSVLDLNDEDRRMIEAIKREQLLSGKKAGAVKDELWGNGCENVPTHRPIQKPDVGHSNIPGASDLQTGIRTKNVKQVEFPEVDSVRIRPACGSDSAIAGDLEIQFSNSLQSHVCNQIQTHAEDPLGSRHSFHVPLCDDTNTQLPDVSKALLTEEASALAVARLTDGSSAVEPAKQITSITFASRKRASSPPTSPVPCTGVTEAIAGGLVEARSTDSTKQQAELLHSCTSASPTAIRAPQNDVGFSSGKEHRRHVAIAIGKDGSFPQECTASAANSQTSFVEQKSHFVTDNSAEGQAPSPLLQGLRRHDRPVGGIYDKELNPEEAIIDQPLSTNSPRQKTDSACIQDQLADVQESFAPSPFFTKGKESVLAKESKLTFDSYSRRAGDKDFGSSGLLPPSSPDHIARAVPLSPSSPTRKALSGVHITLSPRRIDLDLASPMDTGTEMRRVDELKAGPLSASLNAPSLVSEATSKLKPTELFSKTQDSAYFPRPKSSPDSHLRHSHVPPQSWEPLESRQNVPVADQGSAEVLGSSGEILKITAASQTERLLSDAITQITESPERTTYSAEIFVSPDDDAADGSRPSPQKSHEIPSTTTSAVNQVSILHRQAGKPLLLPYKPPGSSEMYYVPCPKETLRLSRVRSETTVESSHSGSNDAIPPEFPAQALGSRDENPPEVVAMKHSEGIYSKRVAPKVAWTEEKRAAQEGIKVSATIRNPLESVKTTHSVFRSAQFYLHHPVPLQHETDFFAGSEVLGLYAENGHSAPPLRDFLQYMRGSQASFSLHQASGEEKFAPLHAELDHSLMEESRVRETFERDSLRKEPAQAEARKTSHNTAKDLPLPSSQMTSFEEKEVADLPGMQSSHFTGSLDELWTKYLQRQKQQQHQCPPGGGSRSELSLVERLDRLARLLQNPIRQSLMPAKDEHSNVQEEAKRQEPKIRSQEKTGNLAPYGSLETAEECPGSTSNARLLKSRQRKIGDITTRNRANRTLEQDWNSETQSNSSSDARPVQDSSVFTDISASESDVTTQAETETATQTEASVSVSTIDTARLVRAFGHDRVQASPRLSQLYNTINLQKTRSEKWTKRSRKAMGADYPKASHSEPKRKDAQAAASVISSDSISTIASSRGPSTALSNKRNAQMLNKAVQAGDFEIVSSATKKNTRDVGLTFPTPTSSQARLRGDRWGGTEADFSQPDGLATGSKGRQKRQPSSFFAEKRPRRIKSRWLQGVSWFVPAEDLKSYSKQEGGSNFIPDPSPSWFEPVTSTKPWREPLRERNWQEDCRGLQVRQMAPARDVENKPPPPFVKMTLQEALALHRPDFISRSGERVKRLKLIMEERKLQSVLQSEREELFNPPEERRASRSGNCLLPNRGYRAIQRRRAISKNEMVQRSKRIYEQLPEVRKRREEEKRKSDYSTYRLKAQLYKAKITNRILGRKVPWE